MRKSLYYVSFAVLLAFSAIFVCKGEPSKQNVKERFKMAGGCYISDDTHIRRFVEITFIDCLWECDIRASCKAAKYFRNLHLCELVAEEDSALKAAKGKKRDCELAEKTSNQTSQRCECGDGRVCDISTKTCPIKECKPPVIRNANILGNRNFIGAKRIVVCNEGTFKVNGKKQIQCKENGSWEPNITCRNETFAGNCRNDSDCEETNATCIKRDDTADTGKCVCQHLFKYDDQTRDCVQECSEMSDNFTKHENKIIKSYNIFPGNDTHKSALSECEQACVKFPSCLSFDFEKGYICNFNSVTMEMISLVDKEALVEGQGDLYSRKCTQLN